MSKIVKRAVQGSAEEGGAVAVGAVVGMVAGDRGAEGVRGRRRGEWMIFEARSVRAVVDWVEGNESMVCR